MLTLGNAGLPMMLVYGPLLAFAFVPAVLIEAGWLSWRRHIPFSRTAWAAVVANIASSVGGVPLTWGALLMLQMMTGGGRAYGANVLAVTWQAPWLIPYEDEFHWMIPTAGLVLSVPFFIVSGGLELLVLRKLLKSTPRLSSAVWGANAISYGLIAAFWAVSLVAGLWG